MNSPTEAPRKTKKGFVRRAEQSKQRRAAQPPAHSSTSPDFRRLIDLI